MSRNTPNDKVAFGTLGGSLAALLLWLLSLWGVEVPAEVAAAIAVVCGSLVAYLVPERYWLRTQVYKATATPAEPAVKVKPAKRGKKE